jgi:hypothetical protein
MRNSTEALESSKVKIAITQIAKAKAKANTEIAKLLTHHTISVREGIMAKIQRSTRISHLFGTTTIGRRSSVLGKHFKLWRFSFAFLYK